MNENQIRALHTRLNFPGVDATLLAAKKWARDQNPPLDPPAKAQVAEVIRKRTTKQVFTPARTTVGGHHASPGPGLYQQDLISMEAVQGDYRGKTPADVPLKKLQGLYRGRGSFAYQCSQARTLSESKIVLHGMRSKYMAKTHIYVGLSRACNLDQLTDAP